MGRTHIVQGSNSVFHPSTRSISVSACFLGAHDIVSPKSKRRISRSRMGIPSRVLRIWRSQNFKVLDRVLTRRNIRQHRINQVFSQNFRCSSVNEHLHIGKEHTSLTDGSSAKFENVNKIEQNRISSLTNKCYETEGLTVSNFKVKRTYSTSATSCLNTRQFSNWENYHESFGQRVIALDCEMVGVGPKGRRNALARCSIVDYDGNVIYDQYIEPSEPITDYRTRWSGVNEKHMENAIPFCQAQEQIAEILNGNIVIGHAIFNDFQVIKIHHPSEHIRDTAKYQGLRDIAFVGLSGNVGLKRLSWILLKRKIQCGPHCSVEDAKASMDLYRLVEKQWEDEIASLFPDIDFRKSFMDDHFWPDGH